MHPDNITGNRASNRGNVQLFMLSVSDGIIHNFIPHLVTVLLHNRSTKSHKKVTPNFELIFDKLMVHTDAQ